MFKALKIIFSVLIAVVLTVFAVKNSHIVAIDLWPIPLRFNLTLSLVIIGAFALGAGFGGILVWISQIRKRLFKTHNKEHNQTFPETSIVIPKRSQTSSFVPKL